MQGAFRVASTKCSLPQIYLSPIGYWRLVLSNDRFGINCWYDTAYCLKLHHCIFDFPKFENQKWGRKGCTPNARIRFYPNVSLFQYSCRFPLIRFITTEKSICSFQRIFFKKAFHQILRVSSAANLSVKRARFSR